MRKLLAALALAGVLSGCAAPVQRPVSLLPQVDPSNAGLGRMDYIQSVVDGDTVILRGDEQRVRILGIDSPETVSPDQRSGRKPPECWGLESSAWAKRTLAPGTQVRIEFEPNTDDRSRIDRYGRLLGYVMYKASDTSWRNFSVESARAGMSRNYVYGKKPVSRQNQIAAAEQDAKNARRGLWGRCA